MASNSSNFHVDRVDQYISRNLKHEIKLVKDYNSVKTLNGQKVKTPKIRKQPKECKLLREKILTKYADCFKETIGPEDRVRIKPIHLEIDKSWGIRPVHANKLHDVPIHMRKAADAEFIEMLNSGILSKVDHVTSWCSTSFPVAKPGSDPLKVRWVSDFRNLIRALRMQRVIRPDNEEN